MVKSKKSANRHRGNVTIRKAGRIVIPSDYRKALQLKPGDKLTLIMEDDGLRMLSPRQAIERAQKLVRQHVPKGRSLSRELIEERRRQAKDE